MEPRTIYKIILTGLFLMVVFVASDKVFARMYSAKAYLGVCIEELDKEKRDELNVKHGILVTRVMKESPAEEAGIVEDDIIQSFDEKKVRRVRDLIRYIRHVEPEEKVEIQIVREDSKKEIIVELGKYRSRHKYKLQEGDDQCLLFSYRGGAYLGIKLQRMDRDLARYFGAQENSGALILEVEEDSPAEKADLKSGDIITGIDGKKVASPEDVQDMLSDLEESDEIEVKLIRNRKEMTFQADLDRKSWYFQVPGKKDCDIEDFKDFRDFRIDLPHIEIDIPEIDFEFKMDYDI